MYVFMYVCIAIASSFMIETTFLYVCMYVTKVIAMKSGSPKGFLLSLLFHALTYRSLAIGPVVQAWLSRRYYTILYTVRKHAYVSVCGMWYVYV